MEGHRLTFSVGSFQASLDTLGKYNSDHKSVKGDWTPRALPIHKVALHPPVLSIFLRVLYYHPSLQCVTVPSTQKSVKSLVDFIESDAFQGQKGTLYPIILFSISCFDW